MDKKEDFNKDFEKENKEERTENREDEVSKQHLKDVSGGAAKLPGGESLAPPVLAQPDAELPFKDFKGEKRGSNQGKIEP